MLTVGVAVSMCSRSGEVTLLGNIIALSTGIWFALLTLSLIHISFEEDIENSRAYLYVGSTLDNKADGNGYGPVAFFKLDATTGEIIWQKEFKVYTTKNVTGGIMSSAVLGEGNVAVSYTHLSALLLPAHGF